MSKKILEQEIMKDFTALRQGEIYYKIIQGIEKIMIERALEITYGNKISAAKMLGINRNTLQSKIRLLSIDARNFKRYVL